MGDISSGCCCCCDLRLRFANPPSAMIAAEGDLSLLTLPVKIGVALDWQEADAEAEEGGSATGDGRWNGRRSRDKERSRRFFHLLA